MDEMNQVRRRDWSVQHEMVHHQAPQELQKLRITMVGMDIRGFGPRAKLKQVA